MNNGKVRIYDLAKELKLDNRVVLEICDQKNIQYKSHSSTISETEAEMIRTAAEKYVPATPSPQRSAQRAQPVPPPTKSQPRPQQILEIRHRPPTAESISGANQSIATLGATGGASVETEPRLAAPPTISRPPSRAGESGQPAVVPSAPAAGVTTVIRPDVEPKSTRPESPNRPEVAAVRPGTSPQKSAASPVAPAAPAPAEMAPPRAPAQSTQKPAASATGSKPPARPTANSPAAKPAQPKIELVGAPTKPVAPVASEDGRTHPQRPQLRVNRAGGPQQPGRTSELVAESAEAKGHERPTLQPPPRLQPPPTRLVNKPTSSGQRAAGSASPEAKEGDTIEVLKDLSLSKLGSRGKRGVKTKAQEEEDLQEELLKNAAAAKAGNKTKRRGQTQTEEDDDIDFALDVNNRNIVDVSQSLVRPPKPKSAKQARPAAVATTRISPNKSSGNRASRSRQRRNQEEVQERPEVILLIGDLTVQELAYKLVVEPSEVIKTLFFKGIAATINQMLDLETAKMVAEALGAEVMAGEAESAARKVTEMLAAEDLDNLVRRPPVVTIMGHVDHGKTTLLDSIRKTKVAQGEAGGITQHIGAYHVDVEHAGAMQQVVFLDTPGHEAFTAMRARGARVTDVAILVVAADDGVRPQTIEAISHAKAAEVPIVVAINKVDKPSAQPDRVKQELTEYGLVSEEWGGETIMVPVSAINGENLDTLLEMILLVSEVEDLYANPNRPARGTVIEAHLDKARGAVASLLVQNGTLKVGDILVAGSAMGKVRAMIDDRSKRVEIATPSFAVEVLGLGDVPAAGDEFEVFRDEKEARALATERADQQRQSRLLQALSSRRVSLTGLSDQAREGELKELNIILKADVQGSLEAILNALGQLPQNEVQVRVLLSAPGEITETDVDLAAASSAVILGFNTTLATGARQASDQTGVDIREYNIIYKLLDDIQGAMEGLLEPELVEEDLGQAQVRAVFPVGKGSVAGCYVQNGKLIRNCKVRIHRGSQVIHSGGLNSLKRMKEDAKEVNSGYECGVRLDDFQTWQEGDIIEAFQLVTKRRTLSPA
jgi:translation initiation factor IF-2